MNPGFEALQGRRPNRLIRLYFPERLAALKEEPESWAVFKPLVDRDLVEVKAKGPAWRARTEGSKLPQFTIILMMDCLNNLQDQRLASERND